MGRVAQRRRARLRASDEEAARTSWQLQRSVEPVGPLRALPSASGRRRRSGSTTPSQPLHDATRWRQASPGDERRCLEDHDAHDQRVLRVGPSIRARPLHQEGTWYPGIFFYDSRTRCPNRRDLAPLHLSLAGHGRTSMSLFCAARSGRLRLTRMGAVLLHRRLRPLPYREKACVRGRPIAHERFDTAAFQEFCGEAPLDLEEATRDVLQDRDGEKERLRQKVGALSGARGRDVHGSLLGRASRQWRATPASRR